MSFKRKIIKKKQSKKKRKYLIKGGSGSISYDTRDTKDKSNYFKDHPWDKRFKITKKKDAKSALIEEKNNFEFVVWYDTYGDDIN